MSITKDATKGWARPANASEWTELLAGTGIANPDHWWPCTEGSGNLSDVIGSLTLTAKTTPNYGVAATGWAGTGVDATDGTADGFVAGSGVGPDPSTTSQVWIFVVSIETEPTAARTFIGMTGGPTGFAVSFQPAAGTNKMRATCVGVSTDGTADHSTGSYVFALRYDRAASAAKASSDLETVSTTYSASAVDGNKGFGIGSSTPGAVTVLGIGLWKAANAESLSDANITTIRSKIEAPPAGINVDEDPGYLKPEALLPPPIIQRPVTIQPEEFPSANFALEDDWNKPQQQKGHPDPLFLPPRYPAGFASEEWPTPVVAFYLEDDRRYLPFTRPTQKINYRFPAGWTDEVIPLAIGGTTVAPPGSTLDALRTGSGTFKWVAAIEGYQYLLTDATTTQATAAWSGTGFTQALHGLYVSVDLSQTIDPWNPFANTGGRLTLQMSHDTNDQFGIDTHFNEPSAETQITDDIDCDDSTIPVKSTASFASSGVAYIGTEAIRYTGKTSTTLTGVNRGLYPALRAGPSGTFGFAHPHSVVEDANAIALEPVVSDSPRTATWVGRWVCLKRHLLKAGGLNTRSDALTVFAGRIVGVKDNPATMTTDVEVEHCLQSIGKTVIGANLWRAKIKEGLALADGMTFDASDTDGTTPLDAGTLTVVSGASGSYEVEPGTYEIGEIISLINSWLATALTDGDLNGTYSLTLEGQPGQVRTRLEYRIPGVSVSAGFSIALPDPVWKMLGELPDGDPQGTSANPQRRISRIGETAGVTRHISSPKPPLRHLVNSQNQQGWRSLEVYDEYNDVFYQGNTLPAHMQGLLNFNIGSAVLVLFDGNVPAICNKVGSELSSVQSIEGYGNADATVPYGADFSIVIDDPRGPITVQQYFHVVDKCSTVMKCLIYSTGTAGYNHGTYDAYPATIGCAVPGEILAGEFEKSVDNMPGADDALALVVAKPITLENLLSSDLQLRWCFLRWFQGHVQIWTWMTPITGVALTESNKANPVDTNDEQRSAATLDNSWQRSVIKVDYNRDFTSNGKATDGSDYHAHVIIDDRVAIDDAGGAAKTQTIPARNTYDQWYLGGSGGVELLMPRFRAIAPFFTKPVRRLTRTIAPTLFEELAPGEVVLFTDAFARDPSTGARGVSGRPGIVVGHGYSPGGFTPDGSVSGMHGQVDIMFLDSLRVGPYVPTAEVTAYDNALHQWTLSAHSHSGSLDVLDASWMSAGRKVRVVEVDPADPATPESYDLTVQSVSGNQVVTTLGAAADPTVKTYRMIWDDYPDAITDQRSYTFQADDADGRVADLRAPFHYTVSSAHANVTLGTAAFGGNSPDDPVELPPDNSYGDGKGLDVGTEAAICRLINNLFDYKMTVQAPTLGAEMIVLGDTTHAYTLTAIIPINLTPDGLSTHVGRWLYVAPFCKSSDGLGLVRITLSRGIPGNDSVSDVDRGFIYGSVEFTATSTTYTTPTEQAINIGTTRDSFGTAYLLIEQKVPTSSGSNIVSCRGLGTCYESARRVS